MTTILYNSNKQRLLKKEKVWPIHKFQLCSHKLFLQQKFRKNLMNAKTIIVYFFLSFLMPNYGATMQKRRSIDVLVLTSDSRRTNGSLEPIHY